MVLRTALSLLVLGVAGTASAQESETPVEPVAVPVPVPVKSVEVTVPVQPIPVQPIPVQPGQGEPAVPPIVGAPVVPGASADVVVPGVVAPGVVVSGADPKAASPTVQIRAGRKGHALPELPAEYSSRDKNGDGQIGLYEWDRKKFAEFTKLDKNGDGFLTAVELLPKGVMKSFYSKSPSRSGSSGTGSVAGAVAAVPVAGDAIDQEARRTFGDMDDNKDGAIDESDWGRSRRIRPWFEGVGIKVSLPMNIDAFVANYRRAKESQNR